LHDFLRGYFSVLQIGIENANIGAIGCELDRNSPADAAAAAGYDCEFVVQAKLAC